MHNITRTTRTTQLAVVGALALAVASCTPAAKPGDLRIALPQKVSALSIEDAAFIHATLEIPGLLAETDLSLSRDLKEATGNFSVAVTKKTDAPFVIRLRYKPDDNNTVLLARLDGTITIRPHLDNALAPTGAFDTCGNTEPGGPCSLLFDLNRNGQDNLTDLVAGFDPRPPPPFVDVAPSDLAFASGIRLGTFSRQVIVVENTSAHPVEVTTALIDAPGATLQPFETEPTPESGAARTLNLGVLDPFQEVLVAVSFAPVNPFLTVGDVFVEARDPVTNVRQATRVRLLANVDGALQPPPAGFPTPVIPPLSGLGGFTGSVEAFPTTSLFNGLPVSSVASADGVIAGLPYLGGKITAQFADGQASVPADHSFLVSIPVDHKLAVSLSGLTSDVDLSVFLLDPNGAISADGTRNVKIGKAGVSAEAFEASNDSGVDESALVVIGRVEVDPPPAAAGALTVSVPTPFALSAHVTSAPEFTAPLAPLGGPLEGGTRVTLRGKRFNPLAQVIFADSVALDCTFSVDASSGAQESIFDCTTPPGQLLIGKNPATIVVANPAQDEGGDGQAATLPEGFTYEPPAPRLDQLLPAVAPETGSTGVIALRGAFFSQRNGVPQVTFDGVLASGVRFVDSTRIEVAAPPHLPGIAVVEVQNILDPIAGNPEPHLSLPSNARNFTYVHPDQGPPTVSSISPATGSIDGGDEVTITGTNFLDNPTILFDGQKANDIVFVGATSLRCSSPARDNAGGANIEVINIDGQRASVDAGFTYFIPDPSVDTAFPDTAGVDGGTFVVITGSGFRAGVSVDFVNAGGVAVHSPNVNRVSTSTILAASPAVASDAAGTYTLRIRNLDGRTADLAGPFRILQPTGPRPRIDSLSPNTGNKDLPVIATITGVNIRGSGQGTLPAVLVGSQVATVTDFVVGAVDTVTFIIPTSATAGPVVVRVIDDDGQSDTSVYTYFTQLGSPPVIDTLTPSSAGKNQSIHIVGRSFDVVDDGQGGTSLSPDARLLVGGQLVFPDGATATTLDVRVPDLDSLVGPSGATVAIELSNIDGQSTSAVFQYVPTSRSPTPVIQSVSPGVAHVGDVVTIAGSGFDLSSLQLGNVIVPVDSTVFTSVTASAVTFTMPDPGVALPAVVAVALRNQDGKTANATLGVEDVLVVPAPAPSITAIAPQTVLNTGGAAVIITGSDFQPGAVVTVAGQPVTANVTSSSISFAAPAHALPGSVVVTVTNPDRQAASIILGYTDVPPPPPSGTAARIDAIDPGQSALAGGDVVTLSGAGFNAAGVLTVGGVVTSRTITATRVTFTAPAHSPGVVVVAFTNPNATPAQILFTYLSGAAPGVSFVNPDVLHALVPGDVVTILGQGMANVVDVFVQPRAIAAAGPPTGTGPGLLCDLLSATDLQVKVRIRDPLPDGPFLEFVLTNADGTTLISPPFTAVRPNITGTFGGQQGGQLLIIGDHLNPGALIGVALVGGPQPVPLQLSSATETLIVTGTLPPAVPGVTFSLALIYQDFTTGAALPPIVPTNAPTIALSPIDIDANAFGSLIPADSNLNGETDFVRFTTSFFNAAAGSPTTFVLLDAAGVVVADGNWNLLGGGEGGIDPFTAALHFNPTAPLAPGFYRLQLASTTSPDVAVTTNSALQAVDRAVNQVSPSTVIFGQLATATGTAFFGDDLVVEDVATGAATIQATIGINNCSPNQPGCFSQPSFDVPNSGLAAGSYRVCAVAPGQPAACPVSPAVLTVVDPCGDGTCNNGETRATCPQDCGFCGDNNCQVGEDAVSCPGDCIPNTCGNRTCEVAAGETATSCVADCGAVSFFGVQQNVPEASLTGWTQCFAGPFGVDLPTAQIFQQCQGARMMLACRTTGNPIIQLLAEAPRDDVIFDVGFGNNTHTANGTNWYFSTTQSWGFAGAGDSVSRNSCDTASANGDKRLCWHTGQNVGGFRCGNNSGLNGDFTFERLVYVANGVGSVCGDSKCDPPETNASCPQDCPVICGNGLCEAPETTQTCPQDCPPVCGNARCEFPENSSTCPQDCTITGGGNSNVSYTALNCQFSADHENAGPPNETGDDRGGIAVNSQFGYYSGDIRTSRFDVNAPLAFTGTSHLHDGIFSDIATGGVFDLFNTPSLAEINGAAGGTFTVTDLEGLDPVTLDPNGLRIPLSIPITVGPMNLGSSNSGVFAGSDLLVLLDGSNHFFAITISTGAVIDLGVHLGHTPFAACESWAVWGVARVDPATGDVIVEGVSGGSIHAFDITTDVDSVKSTFGDLGDMCSIAILPSQNRWYWHAEVPPGSLGIGLSQRFGFCDTAPPP